MPVDPRFTVRPYRTGDEHAILDLFARSFPHAPRSLAHFDWKYRRNPFGNERISLTFDEENRLVGHYCGYSVPFRGFGEDVLAHQIGDTMTDPAIRHIGRGPTSILGRTALHFYEHFCEGQVAFNYGYNVGNIQKISLRFLRSDRAEPVTYRIRTQRFTPLGRADRWLRGYQLELVQDVDREWDAFFARASRHYDFLVRRDARYVRWRYLECPDVQYTLVAIRKWRHLVGWIAYRVREGRFQWGDALFDREFPDAVEVALRHLVPPLGVSAVEGWFSSRPQWFDEILRELGFETRPEPQDLSVMCVPFRWANATDRMRAALYFTWGDSDLF